MSHDHPHPHPHPDPRPTPQASAPAGTPATPGGPTGTGPIEDAGTQALSEALRSSFNIVKLLMFGLVAAFVFSGIFTVEPNEVAVRLTFGRIRGVGPDQLLAPGPHWKLPYPIDEVVKIPVGESRTVTSTAGWYAITPQEELEGGKRPENAMPILQPGVDGYALSGDGNIIHVRVTVNYRISDPRQYAFEFANATNILQNALDNALLWAAARFNADDAIYRRRGAFQEAVIERLNRTLEQAQLGVTIDPREVRVDPPLYVQTAFTDVLKAQQNGDIKISEAEAYARGVTNKAIGEASAVVQNSLTLSNTLVQAVATDATNFLGLLPAWQRDAPLLRARLLAEANERVLTNADFKAFLPRRADGQPRELRLQLSRPPEAPRRIGATTTP